MKTLLTFALAAATFAAAAQTKSVAVASSAAAPAATAPDAYTAAMLGIVAEQNAAKTPADLQANLAKLERVAAAAPTAWEARYYQARAYVKLGFAGTDGDAQDKLFDQAQAALDQGFKSKGADRAELLVMQAYLNQGRIMVSPMLRGALYTGRVQGALDEAKALSPDNPRVYLVLANDLYFRPAVFGGGADMAKPLYEKALALFATFKPTTALSPAWGQANAASTLAKINGETVAK